MTQKCTYNKAKNKIKLNHAKHVMNSKERKKVAEESTTTKRETNGKMMNLYPEIHLNVNGLKGKIFQNRYKNKIQLYTIYYLQKTTLNIDAYRLRVKGYDTELENLYKI